MMIREDYLKQIRPFYHKNLVKVITGIRRSGKSTLLLQIQQELISGGVDASQIIHLNLDFYQHEHLRYKDALYQYIIDHLHQEKSYVFIDEIQEVEAFETIINSLNSYQNVDIYLTGSNSKMLSGEYATYLTGRYVSFEVFPFSFKELSIYYPEKSQEKIFNDYIIYGGFPQVQMFSGDAEKKTLLTDLYHSIVVKDIAERHKIRNVSSLEKYLLYLNNTTSSLFSAENITAYFKNEGRTISKETLYNYIRYAKDAYYIYSAQRYDINGKKLLTTNEKVYINDHGFRSIFFNNQRDIEKILENIVYFELLRRGYKVYVGNIDNYEIDFVAEKGNEKIYIQVSYMLSSETTMKREFRSLLKVADQFPKYVLSMDQLDMSSEGIKHRNIIGFLLGNDI
ncbi:MAG: ATP-binding protein [Acholeplasmataceae bacterium]|nr:MAG: ATP-binding protein [Acholeplasmataceae bacterium]